MAEAKNVTFDSIMADLKARKFVPLYYLMGRACSAARGARF